MRQFLIFFKYKNSILNSDKQGGNIDFSLLHIELMGSFTHKKKKKSGKMQFFF